ncbi:C-type lectin domain family 4 member G isoform X2 [Carlito syrichta]|uniref:C-type lectin domain family 4 member G isoform X2 n=1 Tax=Carlito syrichta TaxID=1868482 RepID=A0A1U7TLF3_CARSF|nr:C-type lectin domain family 4 member G isoform X2 [Carlito syrichta]
MDTTTKYRPWGCWEYGSRRPLFLALAFLVATVLWAVILSILVSKASTESGALRGSQDLLRRNASKQTTVLGALKEEIGACHNCCSGAHVELQTMSAELGKAQAKLMEQESALKDLSEQVTQGLAKAGRDREDVRSELFRVLGTIRFQNSSCEPCPASWLPFEGSCYYFSENKASWVAAQTHCAGASAHLVIVGGLEEQNFLTRNTAGRGYWMGLRAVRHLGKVQSYQWVDGVALSFSHWNQGEPNDSRGRENCVMLLHTGLWNDAPCDNERDNWICEKRHSC